jgi:excisionase family DNA binding protein
MKSTQKTIKRLSHASACMSDLELKRGKIYTVTQTASLLQMDERTVRKLVHRGDLPASKTAAGIRIEGKNIARYLEKTRIMRKD